LDRPVAEVIDPEEACSTCASLKQQEQAAAVELARARGLPNSEDIYQEWTRLFRSMLDHRFKAHNNQPRGRE
jgi:hypothetical protein